MDSLAAHELASQALPLIQFVEREGIIDLGWGHPDPELVPLEALRNAAAKAFDRYGPDALAYGAAAGPGPLIELIRTRLAETDGRAPARGEVLITGGSSAALDQVATMLTDAGDVVLIEAPTYHLAISIFRDHPLRLVPVPSDADGLRSQSDETVSNFTRSTLAEVPRDCACQRLIHFNRRGPSQISARLRDIDNKRT